MLLLGLLSAGAAVGLDGRRELFGTVPSRSPPPPPIPPLPPLDGSSTFVVRSGHQYVSACTGADRRPCASDGATAHERVHGAPIYAVPRRVDDAPRAEPIVRD